VRYGERTSRVLVAGPAGRRAIAPSSVAATAPMRSVPAPGELEAAAEVMVVLPQGRVEGKADEEVVAEASLDTRRPGDEGADLELVPGREEHHVGGVEEDLAREAPHEPSGTDTEERVQPIERPPDLDAEGPAESDRELDRERVAQ